MEKEKVNHLRQDIINALYIHTELSENEIYRITEEILRKNNLTNT